MRPHPRMPRFFSLRGFAGTGEALALGWDKGFIADSWTACFEACHESIGGFRDGGFRDRDELVEEVAQCHDVRVSGHGAADALDGQACGPSQRWKAASMRPHSTPTSQPVRRHHTLGTLLATMSTVSNGVPGGSNEVFGVWRRDAPDGCPNRHDDGMRN